VEKTIQAASIAKAPAEIVNLGGTEAITTQEYCEIAGEMVGKKPVFVENSSTWPIWADTTKMVKLLGPNKVSMREGIRRTLENTSARLTGVKHHVLGQPEPADA
jgi:nucleoside-diphosphate-sugar epimerase